MKKALFIILFAVIQQVSVAQDVKKVKEQLAANNITGAKTMIDQMLANPKNQKNAEAWYLKGKTYSAMAVNPTQGCQSGCTHDCTGSI